MHSDSPKPSPRSEVRLQKYLASCGLGSRRRCEDLITAGLVSVDDRVIQELGSKIPAEGARVTVRGKPVQPEAHAYLLLHKPPGYLCTNRDPRGRPTFHALMPRLTGRVYSVGRLDAASEGLLLITNDGDWAHRLMHPRHHVRKVYRVWTTRPLSAKDRESLREGMDVDGVRMRMESVRTLPSPTGNACAEMVLKEGRNRQIRRMLGVRGIGVTRLVRVAFGPLRLGALPSGHVRSLTPQEIEAVSEQAR